MRSKYELRCEKQLQKGGYITDYKIRPSRNMRNAPVDYFHLFDILAVKPKEFKLISVKGKSCPKKHKSDLQRFAQLIAMPSISIELWRFDREPKLKSKIRLRITRYE